MDKAEQTGLELRVTEGNARDVGRALARMGPEDLILLDAAVGDLVEVRGKRATVCKAMLAHKELRAQSRVQLDGVVRGNAGAAIDETVTLKKVAARAANLVQLTPINAAPAPGDLDYIAGLLDGLPVIEGDRIRATLFGSRNADFKVTSCTPRGPVLIGPNTELSIGRPAKGEPAVVAPSLSYEDVGGLKPQLMRIREMIELPLRYPEVFERLGVDAPKGVLLYGPPGCGKTLIARAIAHECDAAFFSVSGPEVIHKFYGESEAHLRKIFEEAARKAPAIVFLDEIDAIAPKRETVVGEVEKRVVAQLLALMDGLNGRQQVIVIAATNLPNALDPALRRPGRFDREIAIPIPDRNGRLEVLEIHSRGMPLAADVDLDRLADITHGFVGADLEALCKEAAMLCLRRLMSTLDLGLRTISYEQLDRLVVNMDDFLSALAEIDPSAIREVFVEVPNVRWEDVGGLGNAKAQLIEALEWPLRYPELLTRAGAKPSKGILLVGPPGCGKTWLAKAAANECGVNFIPVKGPELMSKYIGESEKGVRDVFRKARHAAPCLLFFDEIDALAPRRGEGASGAHVPERLLSQFLAEFDGIEELKGVMVLAATNRIDMLDPAVLRPGRFDEIVEIALPDPAARREIFDVHLRRKPLAADVTGDWLAEASSGFSAAEIASVCRRAALSAVRRALAADIRDPARLHLSAADLDDAIQEASQRRKQTQ
ncbi:MULTISPECIES: CDC48 family AAA ATPase [Burkholderia]|uniref:AAA family ATPase n=1 Tax=Burkholderia savannae TaxID=1637837 RepID=A0ABR5T3L1_9BURK|nr:MULTISPECIES: CDC48 family AAA ATPase [Burkholderia]AOJ71122.1 AAA family ATPase [Burkholderia savannae]AOJ84257.1 AAA family ATPase [Burkholderia savannae]AOK49517.1 AAA family ATPase [Burkholderia sp. MSMB617WGS]KGS08508.1 ATP-dependent metallopeptidase HflB family protein [Burkholderia sp. ABCPW 111]KVG48810.1 AAA family ATPase [Burkholderia sp. MSMB0265]